MGNFWPHKKIGSTRWGLSGNVFMGCFWLKWFSPCARPSHFPWSLPSKSWSLSTILLANFSVLFLVVFGCTHLLAQKKKIGVLVFLSSIFLLPLMTAILSCLPSPSSNTHRGGNRTVVPTGVEVRHGGGGSRYKAGGNEVPQKL